MPWAKQNSILSKVPWRSKFRPGGILFLAVEIFPSAKKKFHFMEKPLGSQLNFA